MFITLLKITHLLIYSVVMNYGNLLSNQKNVLGGGVLEVGVWRGGTGALLAAAVNNVGINEKVYLFDTFTGVVKTSDKDDPSFYHDGKHNDTSIEIVKNLIKSMGLANVELHRGIFPEEADPIFLTKKYRFVHIDVDIYESAKDIFFTIWKNVVNGGMVVFDDYGFVSTKGVTALLNEIKNTIMDGIFYYNVNGHGVFIKTK